MKYGANYNAYQLTIGVNENNLDRNRPARCRIGKCFILDTLGFILLGSAFKRKLKSKRYIYRFIRTKERRPITVRDRKGQSREKRLVFFLAIILFHRRDFASHTLMKSNVL